MKTKNCKEKSIASQNTSLAHRLYCKRYCIYKKVYHKWLTGSKIHTTHNMKFSIKNFFSKCDQIHSFLRNWSHLLKKSLTENFIFRAVYLFIFLFVLHNIYHNVRIFLCDRSLFRFYKRRGKQLLRWLPNF